MVSDPNSGRSGDRPSVRKTEAKQQRARAPGQSGDRLASVELARQKRRSEIRASVKAHLVSVLRGSHS
jgi:hypothetical protein